jgi:hypothetical protein
MLRVPIDWGKGLVVFVILVLSWSLAQPTITGTLDNYTAGAADIVAETREGVMWLPVDLGTGPLFADGKFTVTLVSADKVPADVYMPITSLFPADKCEGLTLSDSSAKIVAVRELRVIPKGASCEYCGTVGMAYAATQTRGSLPRTGDLSGAWFLADRPVTITGTCTYGWGQEVYDMTLQQGWNSVALETAEVKPATEFCDCVTMKIEQRSLVPSELVWHFQPFQ